MNFQRLATPPVRQQLHSRSRGSSVVAPHRQRSWSLSGSNAQEKRGCGAFLSARRTHHQGHVVAVTPLFAVEAAVRCVEVVNERIAWTADCDGSVRVRSAVNGGEMRNLGGREDAFCTCLLFLEEKGKMWVAFSDGFIRVFDVSTHAMEQEFVQHTNAVECMVEMEGNVYTGGRDWKIYQWDPDKYHYVRQFSGHTNSVRCLCSYSGDTGSVLFSGSDDGTVKAWNPYFSQTPSREENSCLHTFVGHARSVLALELLEANNQLWSAGEDKTVRVWDLQDLECVAVLKHHSAPVNCLRLVESRVWSGDKHGRIILWDHRELVPLEELSRRTPLEHRSVLAIRKMVPSVVWKVWTVGSAGQIHCWNAESEPLALDGGTHWALLPCSGEEKREEEEEGEGEEENGGKRSGVEGEKHSASNEREISTPLRNRARGKDGSGAFSEGPGQQPPTTIKGATGQLGSSGRRKVKEEEKKKNAKNKAEYITPQQVLEDVGTPPYESTTPFSDSVCLTGCSGCVPNRSPVMVPDASHSHTPIVTRQYKRVFPGSAWGDVVQDHANELRAAFIGETCQVLGLSSECLKCASTSLGTTGLVGTLEISHPRTKRADDIQRLLERHAFLDVTNIYVCALERRNKELTETNAVVRKEKEALQSVLKEAGTNKQISEALMAEDRSLVKQLCEELDKTKKLYQKSQEDLQALRSQVANEKSEGIPNVQEEYDALKSFVDGRLKPLISRLKRLNSEKDVDLRANEERINRLMTEVENLKVQVVNGKSEGIPNVQEEYDALKSFVDDRLKPLISRLKRLNSEKDVDLRANEEHINRLMTEVKHLKVQVANRRRVDGVRATDSEQHMRETDPLGRVRTPRAAVKESETSRGHARKSLKAGCVAVVEAEAPHVSECQTPLPLAYRNGVQRRRAAGDESSCAVRHHTPRSARMPGQHNEDTPVVARDCCSAASLGDVAAVVGKMRVNIRDAMQNLKAADENCEEVYSFMKQ